MTNDMFQLDNPVFEYIRNKAVREDDFLVRLREETAMHPAGRMQITPEQGAFLRSLTLMQQPKIAIEIGVFTGYSAAVVAKALPEGGKLIACDHDARHREIQQRYWAEGGLLEKIDFRLALAHDTLDALEDEGLLGKIDMMFVDADKGSYISYFIRGMEFLRPGGLMIFDNVLWGGRVADLANDENLTIALREFNAHIRDDPSVDISLVPIGDGMTLIRKPN